MAALWTTTAATSSRSGEIEAPDGGHTQQRPLLLRRREVGSLWPPMRCRPGGAFQLASSIAGCRWFDLVVVLQTDNTVLWERLEKR